MRQAIVMYMSLCWACKDVPEAPLVSAQEWVWTADDPITDGPEAAVCPEEAWGVEIFDNEVAFEVDTALCNHLSVEQTLLADVSTEDEIYIRLWHDELSASDEPAEGHAALWADGQVLWEQYVPIPSDSEMLAPTFSPVQPMEAGARVVFHLHNHGSNSWTLLEVTRNPE